MDTEGVSLNIERLWAQQIQVALLLAPFVIFIAWIAAKFIDEPIRAKLRQYSLQK
jgi:hypothetical protein